MLFSQKLQFYNFLFVFGFQLFEHDGLGKFKSLTKFWKFWAIISSNIFFLPSSLSHLFLLLIYTYVRPLETVPYIHGHFFPVVQIVYFLLIHLQVIAFREKP